LHWTASINGAKSLYKGSRLALVDLAHAAVIPEKVKQKLNACHVHIDHVHKTGSYAICDKSQNLNYSNTIMT